MNPFDAFDAAVTELILKHGLKPPEIHKRTRQIAKALSKDLTLQILYCGSEGGYYSYSKAFMSFIEEKNAMPDSLVTKCALQYLPSQEYLKERVRDVQWIAPFGRQVMETWPFIAKLVKAYMRNHLGHRMRDIGEIEFHQKRLLEISKISDMIAAESGKADGVKKWETWSLSEKEDFNIYTPAALKDMQTTLDAERSQSILAIQEKRDAVLMHMTEAQYEAMLQSLGTKFVIEEVVDFTQQAAEPKYVHKFVDLEELGTIPQISIPWEENESERAQFTKKLSFIDAIVHYHETHDALWQCQSGFFDERAMRFLVLHPEYMERLLLEGDNEDGAQVLGLCAASSDCCNLRIGEVPLLAEWKLMYNNGRETIRVL